MASTDVAPTRSEASREAALTFINGVPDGTRIGLVAFSAGRVSARSAQRRPRYRARSAGPLARTERRHGDRRRAGGRRPYAAAHRTAGDRARHRRRQQCRQRSARRRVRDRRAGHFDLHRRHRHQRQRPVDSRDQREAPNSTKMRCARSPASGEGTYARVGDAAALRERLGTLARSTSTNGAASTSPCSAAWQPACWRSALLRRARAGAFSVSDPPVDPFGRPAPHVRPRLARRSARRPPIRSRNFAAGFDDALAASALEANAMTLATVDERGRPSARIVLLRGWNERGFVFFTNYESRKGRDIAVESGGSAVVFLGQTRTSSPHRRRGGEAAAQRTPMRISRAVRAVTA